MTSCPSDNPEPPHSSKFLREWQRAVASLPPESVQQLTEYRRRADRPLQRLVDLVDFVSIAECDGLADLLAQTGKGPLAESHLTGYAKHTAQVSRRQAEKVRAAQEVGPLPEVIDPARKAACEFNPQLFLTTYCRAAIPLEFGENHLEMIEKCRVAVLEKKLIAIAMPRGSGKTTICELLCLWAALYGHSKLILFVHATEGKSVEALDHIRDEIEQNDLLFADFPEVCHPVRCLERRSNKARGQTVTGLHTRIKWSGNEIRLPEIPGAKSSGIIIVCAGILSAVRGANKRKRDGTRLRPDFLLIDDPQTDESARSREECRIRLNIITNGLLGLFGPQDRVAGLCPMTVIEKGDVADSLLNRELYPQFRGVRYRMLYGETKRLDLWLQYYDLLKTAQKDDRPATEAQELFVANQIDMEAGMRAGWPARTQGRLTAILYAMELWLDDPFYFFKECQNDPQDPQQSEEKFLRSDDIALKVNSYCRRQAALSTTQVTAHIDIQGKLLFYMVCGWSEGFTGQVLEYGTWPDQQLSHFTARHARPTTFEALEQLGKVGLNQETAVYHSLDVLFRQLATTQYQRVDGVKLKPQLIGVDANQWKKTVFQACVESPFSAGILPCHSLYYGPNETPISSFNTYPGETKGDEWMVTAKGGIQYIKYDGNHWKTFAGRRLASPHPDPGSLTIYGPEGTRHHLLGRHLDSEIRNPTTGKRTIDEWVVRPGETENHWWDCLVGNCVMASVRGCNLITSSRHMVPVIEREILFG